jgi:hypothetical protein
MSVELLAKESDAFALGFRGVGKREGFEAASFYIYRIVPYTKPTTGCERPDDVDAAGENT